MLPLVLSLGLWTTSANGPDHERLVLAEAGQTAYTVVVSADATQPEQHAAAELARCLQEITGAAFRVEATTKATPPHERAILVGRGACQDVIDPETLASLGQEGYVLRAAGARLAIAGGRPRGTLYGVYSFLEEELGCRWFTPDVARIPRQTRLEIGSLDRSFVPRLEYRATDYPNSRDGDWAVRNKLNGTQTQLDERRGGKVAYGPFVHTFNAILDPAEHFAQHPEYFSEVQGRRLRDRTQLCVTNPDVLRLTIDKVRGWMREQPQATIFSVSQNDWYNYCTCPECARVTTEEGTPMGPYLRFVNAVADAVRDDFPEQAVDTLAYQFTRRPPRHTAPRPNVIVRLCSIECCFSHPLTTAGDARNAAFARDLEAWSQLCQRLYIWDYVIDYAHALLPFPNLYTLRPNIRFFVDHGVKGIYEEANYFSPAGELAELRTWLIAKTLWDPDYDTERAIDEFLAGYYEEAAPALRRYIDLIHDEARARSVHFHVFDGPKNALFTADVVEKAAALFADARAAVAGKPGVLARVERASLSVEYLQIAAILARRRDGRPLSDAQRATLQARFAEFDRIAAAAGLTHVSEARTYADWAAQLREVIAVASPQ